MQDGRERRRRRRGEREGEREREKEMRESVCIIHPMCNIVKIIRLLSSQRVWQGIKFGGLVVYLCDHQIKICQHFVYIRMATPYQTTKVKSTNIL